MSKAAENTKDRGTLALLGLMIMCNAVIFTVAGDAPQTFVLAVVGLAGSFVMRTPLPRTTRTFVYAGITALVVTVLSDMIFP
ncbi:MAG: hypothetical protein HON70_43840, partial [Lentisphaerae bacterium]|nr:hypothetical protein [Lentisphaerota bacterium]